MSKHTYREFEGTITLYDNEDRNALISYINEHSSDIKNIYDAIPMEEEYSAESDEDQESFEKSIFIRGFTDTFVEDLVDNLWEELESAANIAIEDFEVDYTGYERC